ncbi:UDP-forming cellulose synthase catalytic subunit [Acidithiobacillus ferrivorans]|uniref:Cellulose synthase catalytic subunit [UDP-forming] n=1 Tax=Acidithiobacillus ferrivorans TaxID=160808 RepID=A0A7T5BFW8_9PROT|nr:UDP-forming cellulose synthase catalytic subunit [Acidithiobacillus ferrivorans]QQD71679.1 UDP-forming cellulose synthase catalytic subunit [Acidithiobacillus ferrivorans]
MSTHNVLKNLSNSMITITIAVALIIVWLLAASPVSTMAEAYIGGSMLAVMISILLIGRKLKFREPWVTPLRIVSIFLAIFLTARYLVWRVEFTIGGFGLISLIAGLMLFAAEVYSMGFAFLGYFVNVYPRHRTPVPLPADESLLPSVDIVVPTYNEPAELLEVTLLGALNITYPKDKVHLHLLDDGGTNDRCNKPLIAEQSLARRHVLQELCLKLGIAYHTRVHNDHAKAGNINAALNNLSGELMVILDADHVPTRDFLTKTVGFFLQDKKCFLVQTPHSFINADPIEKNLGIFHDSPPETELFHNVIQTGLDGWNASFFCGSAAVMRRSMLLEVGGIQGDTITEDAETAMILHAKGYHSVFLNESLSIGLQPETVMSFIAQRVRWAQGALQLLYFKNPLTLPGLKLTQRIAYLASFSYWFFPFSRIVTILAPSMFLFFGVMVYDATTEQYVIYGAPYFLSSIIFSDFIYGKIRWPLISDVYEMVQTPLAAPALAATLLRPRKPTFRVTPKGEQMDKDFLTPTVWVQYTLLLIVSVSLITGGWRWFEHPGQRPQLIFTMLWEIINFMIVAAAVGVTLERKQRREEFRIIPVKPIPAAMMTGTKKIMVEFIDLSANGARLIVMDKQFSTEQLVSTEPLTFLFKSSLHKNLLVSIPATVLNIESGRVGVQFQYRDMQQKAEIVDLIYGDSQHLEARLERRRKRITFFAAYLYIARKSAAGLGNNVSFIAVQSLRSLMENTHKLFIVRTRHWWTLVFSGRSDR